MATLSPVIYPTLIWLSSEHATIDKITIVGSCGKRIDFSLSDTVLKLVWSKLKYGFWFKIYCVVILCGEEEGYILLIQLWGPFGHDIERGVTH